MKTVNLAEIRSELKALRMNRIKDMIREKGLSQAWVARKMNKSCNTLNGWCANKYQPHLVDLFLLALILQCQITDLIHPVDHNLFEV